MDDAIVMTLRLQVLRFSKMPYKAEQQPTSRWYAYGRGIKLKLGDQPVITGKSILIFTGNTAWGKG